MDEKQEHPPWYRLHLLTWLLLFCVGASLMVENVAGQGRYYHWNCGWPLYYTYDNFDFHGRWFFNHARIYRYYSHNLAVNINASVLLFCCTAYSSDYYFQRQSKWHQFSINFILALTAFVALLCANIKYDWVRWYGDEWWELVPFAFIAFGCWCTFWTAWHFAGRGIKRLSKGRSDG